MYGQALHLLSWHFLTPFFTLRGDLGAALVSSRFKFGLWRLLNINRVSLKTEDYSTKDFLLKLETNPVVKHKTV